MTCIKINNFSGGTHTFHILIVSVERMKEIEATNSYYEAITVSGGTTADNVSY